MSKSKFCKFWMTCKGCDTAVANTKWMRRLGDPFNNPQDKGQDGELEIAVRKYRYIDAATGKPRNPSLRQATKTSRNRQRMTSTPSHRMQPTVASA